MYTIYFEYYIIIIATQLLQIETQFTILVAIFMQKLLLNCTKYFGYCVLCAEYVSVCQCDLVEVLCNMPSQAGHMVNIIWPCGSFVYVVIFGPIIIRYTQVYIVVTSLKNLFQLIDMVSTYFAK